MRVGLNAGFGAPIGADDLRAIKGLGWSLVRQDIRSADQAHVLPLLSELAAAGLDAVLVLGPETWPRAEEIAYWVGKVLRPGGAYLEIGNELDNVLDPLLYAARFNDVAEAVKLMTPHARLITAGTRNAGPEAMAWAARVAKLTVGRDFIGVHPYRSGRPGTVDQRRAELAPLEGRPWACTEVGWTYARTSWWPCHRPLSEGQVAAYLREEIRINREAGAELCVVYQLSDGPSSKPIDHMGIRRRDGSWKPAADVPQEV